MADHKLDLSSLPFFALFISFLFLHSARGTVLGPSHGLGEGRGDGGAAGGLRTYIVHLQESDRDAFAGPEERDAWYRSFLSGDEAANAAGFGERRWVHSYHEVLTGFAARLTKEEVVAMKKKEGFLHAYPDAILPLATTHSPAFIGLHLGIGLWGNHAAGGHLGEGVIVGMIDSGITPGHPSFDDKGMPPPPTRWKGSCHPPQFCNKKVIGARNFISGVRPEKDTPTDEVGHGTHTASTAAGTFVNGASVLGNANGTASGVAPRAHLAIYKACNNDGCWLSDIFAAMDAAVADGVDVMSLSLAGEPEPLHSDGIAVVAFGAIKKGVFISCAAGNDGPDEKSVTNGAPWVLTVAASTMDRSLEANVRLGDGSKFQGQSAFQPTGFTHGLLPLAFPGANLSDDSPAVFCEPGSLRRADVKGKIVICLTGGLSEDIEKGEIVLKAGGVAMVLVNDDLDANTTEATVHVLPASHVSFAAGSKIVDYIRASGHPTASISFGGTKLGSSSPPAPAVACFSSRGPNVWSPGVLKPDVTGPGVNVLAAWPSPVGTPAARRRSGGPSFNMLSGTSMSTPHLSGVAVLLKSAHPDWSPAAIRSAILTTSDVQGNDGKPIVDCTFKPASVFAIGAGHVNAARAADPGLVYDLATSDYIAYICGLGFSDQQVGTIVGQRGACSSVKSISSRDLNYPSISVNLTSESSTVAVKRTVTNVGEAVETYKAEVVQPAGVSVSVNPQMLSFSALKEKQSFTVSFTKRGGGGHGFLEGSLRWVSAKHTVRSPISIIVQQRS